MNFLSQIFIRTFLLTIALTSLQIKGKNSMLFQSLSLSLSPSRCVRSQLMII